jgi:hypothetical protein
MICKIEGSMKLKRKLKILNYDSSPHRRSCSQLLSKCSKSWNSNVFMAQASWCLFKPLNVSGSFLKVRGDSLRNVRDGQYDHGFEYLIVIIWESCFTQCCKSLATFPLVLDKLPSITFNICLVWKRKIHICTCFERYFGNIIILLNFMNML